MKFFERTSAVIDKTIKDMTRLTHFIFSFVQLIFLGLYGYKIYINLAEMGLYFYIYIALAALSIFGFIFYLITYRKRQNKGVLNTKRSVRFAKYLANGLMLVFIVIEVASKTNVSDMELLLTSFGVAGFGFQLVGEFFRIMYERYAELLRIAFAKDMEVFEFVRDPKGNIYSLVNAQLESFTGRAEKKKAPTKQEKYVDELAAKFSEEKKEARTASHSEKKAALRENIGALKKKIQQTVGERISGEKDDEETNNKKKK